VRRCIRSAVQSAGVKPEEIDLISGHLTGTKGDPIEVNSWRHALDLLPERFPLLNAPKSLFGHALGAAGAIECVACILQLQGGFVHPSINCEDLHPDLAGYEASIPLTAVRKDLRVIAKSSFGFGDVNACILFRKYTD
jgi:3-oxoacyl-(acyl-carrier-protein) synthase